MIKSKGGKVTIKGNKAEIMADACAVIVMLKNKFGDDNAKKVVNLALMSEKEREDEIERAKGYLITKLFDGILDDIFSEMDKEDK